MIPNYKWMQINILIYKNPYIKIISSIAKHNKLLFYIIINKIIDSSLIILNEIS